MIICSGCGNPLSEDLAFCTECGAEVPKRGSSVLPPLPSEHFDFTASQQPTILTGTDSVPASPVYPPVQTKSPTSKILMLTLGGVLIAAIAGIAYFTTRSNSSADNVAGSLRDAIARGRLVTLTGDDAYTYFFRLKELAPTHKDLSETKPQILPQLRSLGEEVVRTRTTKSLEIMTERDWTIASRAFEWAHVLDANDRTLEARWRYAEGHIARIQGRSNDARANFSTAMKLDSSWAVPVNDFGFLYTVEKKYLEAIPYYQSAINLQADWDIPFNNMGTAYYYQGDLETAEFWYRKALAVNSNWATPHAWLGSIYDMRKDNFAAAQEFQTALNLYNPNRDKFDVNNMQKRADIAGR